MSEVIIRERDDARDLLGAAAALIEVHRSDGYPVEGVSDPQAWLKSGGLLAAFVAVRDGTVVGHVSVSRPQPDDAAAQMYAPAPGEAVAMLGRLFVVPDARRTGAGHQLMAAASSFAQACGLRLLLDVMTKDEAAIRLYENLGWTRLDTMEHDAGNGSTVPAVAMLGPKHSYRSP